MESSPTIDEIRAECLSRANKILAFLASVYPRERGHGSMSVTVYDTAWLSMITKSEDSGSEYWLFPQCFVYILREQNACGSWSAYATPVDGILNTIAGLLALETRSQKHDALSARVPEEEISELLHAFPLNTRILKATEALRGMLRDWDVDSCIHVGFEILVPSLLTYLQSFEVEFQFPHREKLFALNASKLRHFDPVAVQSTQTSLHHSLEAFVGLIDFACLSQFKVNGSLFGSPSSTAAYLMNLPSDSWDSEAEDYLRHVVAQHPLGAVPSAFPSTIFECSWVLSTLLSSGLPLEALDQFHVQDIMNVITAAQGKQQGPIGFFPGVLPDADDTAKALLTVELHGDDVGSALDCMVAEFGAERHFKTYHFERNASFSANCNVLLSLLEARDIARFSQPIGKAIIFLCGICEAGPVRDKWNLAPEYCDMLLVQAFVRVLEKWDGLCLPDFPQDLVYRVSIVLVQSVQRLLLGQSQDGSWGSVSQVETSSYALIALSKSLKLPYDTHLRQQIHAAVDRGSQYLWAHRNSWTQPNLLWVEKVTYGSRILAEIYNLSAMYSITLAEQGTTWTSKVQGILAPPLLQSQQLVKFYSSLPIFHDAHSDRLHNAVVEANVYYHRLSQLGLSVFPRKNMSEDKYLQHIPLTWTSCNIVQGLSLSGEEIWSMILLSMLNYQVDEYMETVVSRLSASSLELLDSILRHLCGVPQTYIHLQPGALKQPAGCSYSNGHPSASKLNSEVSDTNSHSSLHEVETVLGKYVKHILDHACSLNSPQPTRDRLGTDLYTFLVAHMLHNADNELFAKLQDTEPSAQRPSIGSYSSPRENYFAWVRGTAADHTSCPVSFTFFCCLISEAGKHSLSGSREMYTGQALCRHLATLCRQYNDYGSLARDQAEGNLNSLHFPEFGASEERRGLQQAQFLEKAGAASEAQNGDASKNQCASCGDESDAKEDLMYAAQLERSCMDLCMSKLEALKRHSPGSHRTLRALRVFIAVTDVYGQIYVAKDIASRVK